MFKRMFIDHPNSVGETYGEHFEHSLSFGTAMFIGSLACFLHALVPGLCERTGSGVIRRLHDRMVANRVTAKPLPEPGQVVPGGSFI